MEQLLRIAAGVSLRVRLAATALLVIACTATVGLVALAKVRNIDGLVRDLAANDLRGISAVKEASLNLAFVTTAVAQAGFAKDAAEAEYFGSTIASYADLVDVQMVRADSAVQDSIGRARLGDIRAQLPALRAGAGEVVALASAGKGAEAAAKATEVTDASTALAAMFAEVAAIRDFAGDSAVAAAGRAVQSSETTLFSILGVGALVLIVGGLLLAATTLRPIDRAVTVLERVAAGDLSVKAEVVGRDELARLSAALNTAIDAQREASAGLAAAQQASEASAERTRREAEDLVRRVDVMLAIVDQAARGDLRVRIGATETDALGRMGSGLDAFLARMEESIREIADAAGELSHASDEIASGSERLGASAEETAGQAESVSQSAGEVSESVATVVTEAGALSTHTALVHERSHSATGAAREAVQQVRSAQQVLHQLAESGQQVGKVLTDIGTIARQTNLLALNAAVEAARAGDAGAGFAVVAAEVRNLAIQAATASQEIEGRIAAIQTGATAAAAAMGAIGTSIDRVEGMNASIAVAADEQNEVADRMRVALDRASAAARQIASSIAEVAGAAGSSRGDALQSASSAEALSALAQQMETLVSRFKRAEGEVANFRGPDDREPRPPHDAALPHRPHGQRSLPPQLRRTRSPARAVDGGEHRR